MPSLLKAVKDLESNILKLDNQNNNSIWAKWRNGSVARSAARLSSLLTQMPLFSDNEELIEIATKLDTIMRKFNKVTEEGGFKGRTDFWGDDRFSNTEKQLQVALILRMGNFMPGFSKEEFKKYLERKDKDRSGSTFFHDVAKDGSKDASAPEFVQSLAKNNADFSILAADGNTPLHWAVANASNNVASEILYWLPKQHPSLDIISTTYGNTALHLAVGKNYKNVSKQREPLAFLNYELAEQMLKRGANPNIPDRLGNTPLHYAYLHREPEMVKLLERYGAWQCENNERRYPAHYWDLSNEEASKILDEEFAKVYLLNPEREQAVKLP